MTPREKQLWDSLYAACFVSRFEAARAITDFDVAAVRATSFTEYAKAVADLGIAALRYWKENEEGSSGETVEVKL